MFLESCVGFLLFCVCATAGDEDPALTRREWRLTESE